MICNSHVLVVAGRKKDSMKSETTALARQREVTYPDEKKESKHRPWISFLIFSCISNMLVWSVTSRPPLERTPQNGARKLSSPYIFDVGVQLYIFSSSHFAVNSEKRFISSFPPIVSGMNIRISWLCTCVLDLFGTSSFL